MKRNLNPVALPIVILALILVFFWPRFGYSDSKQGITDTTIKIGLFGPMTGPVASFGLAMYGAKMIYDDVNEKGGIQKTRDRVAEPTYFSGSTRVNKMLFC